MESLAEQVKIMVKYTHGMHDTPTHRSWSNMKDRINNPNNPHYMRYGGRGIDMDPRWMKFENFLTDMGVRPPGLTLERIDSEAGYWKLNCRWATRQEQSNNMSRNKRITWKGQSRTYAEWARITGLHPETIRSRHTKTNDPEKIFAPKHVRQGLYR